MIIDACGSGQALGAGNPYYGLDTRGLAGLAYDKGMYILAASHSDEQTLESGLLGHGFLAYTLVEEGIKQGKAALNSLDGRINAEQWLEYASQRVPLLEAERIGLAERQQHPVLFYRREQNPQLLIVGRSPTREQQAK